MAEIEQTDMKELDSKQANTTLAISLAVIVLLITALLTNGFGFFNTTGSVIENSASLQIGNSPVLGNQSAPLTIYIFTDFSCPYCAAAVGENQLAISYLKQSDSNWEAPIPNIIKDYVETRKAKIVFKYYPGHGAGKAAQIVALALFDQNPEWFWKFHDLTFANQNDAGDLVKMKALAASLGANMQKLETDINSGIYEERLQNDIDMAKANGIQGTPSFIINGQTLIGAQSYSKFKKVIDSQLSQ